MTVTVPKTDIRTLVVASEPDPFKRLLVRLGFTQTAFSRNIPNPTKFYWFKCLNCGNISLDYAHGFSGYLECRHCEGLT